jgi:uncharacterized membrane protein
LTAPPAADPRGGRYLFALASVAAGIINIIWRGFEAGHQPIQAFGDHVPGRMVMAYVASAILVAGGLALLRPRTARAGAVATGVMYLIFGIFWLPRFYTVFPILGLRADVYSGLAAGLCQQLILVAGAVLLSAAARPDDAAWRRRAAGIARWTFGISALCFGLSHLANVQSVAALIPAWLPFGGPFWVVLTGVAFMLAGVAFLVRVQDRLAAYLLALMLLIFTVLVLAPGVWAEPGNQVAWGSTAYNIAAIGAVMVFAAGAATRKVDSA